ncbi:MAG: T9SS type A sorting domain-containing protein [Bacteroidetes bacterium]|nr:T9SS type A sorting domain-containing protein [Bacteroidota bacterium]
MKLLRSLITISTALMLFLGLFATTLAKEFPALKNHIPNIGGPKEIAPSAVSENFTLKVKKQNTIQAVDFRILDSLSNAYSYFTDSQKPFVYHIPSGTLVTIKRGYTDLEKDPNYTGTNTKDNLFLLTSTNLGQDWTAPELIFNAKSPGGYGTARYPSIHAFSYENILTYVFTAPTNNASGWYGYVNGLYNVVDKPPASFNGAFNYDGQDYGWAGTESMILGGVDGTDAFGLAVGGLMPPGGNQWDNNSNIGLRKTMTFDKWTPKIPAQWLSAKFYPVSQDSTRSASIIDLEYGPNNSMYMAVEGNFVSQAPNNRVKLGVSISTDYGETWSEFDVSPHQLLRDYAAAIGFDPDSIFMNYNGKGFVVFDNGDFSFALDVYDGAIDGVSQPDSLQLKQIVEIYKENGSWGIRKIADVSGLVIAYLPSGTNNQMGYELQMSRSFDGNTILCKWVEYLGLVDQQTQQTVNTTDILVNGRYKNSSWGEPLDITLSEIWDRITWIPDYVPNGLLNVPILKIETIPNPGDDPATARERQRYLELYPQYVMIGNFDASSVLDVDETTNINSKLSITSIYPNPMDENAEFNFNLPNDGKVDIMIYDLMGKVVKNVFLGLRGAGVQSVKLNIENLPAGAYFCTVSSNGQRATQMITIVR